MSNFKKIASVSAVAILGVTNLLTPLSYANAATWYDSLIESDFTQRVLNFLMPNHDVYLYAETEPNTYYVDYYGNTHTSGTMSRDTFTYDDTWTLSPNGFGKLWYTFTGWNTEASGGGTNYADQASVFNWTAVDSGLINIYAQWKANSYNITYDLNDSAGTSSWVHTMQPSSLNYDQTWNIANPTRQWYAFSGWDISNMDTESHVVWGEDSSAASASGVMGTVFRNLRATSGAVNFLATWSRNPNTPYTVYHFLETLTDNVYEDTAKDTDHLSGYTDTDVTPAVNTYEWFTSPATQTDNIDADGNTEFTYKYTRNSYNLTLNAGRWVSLVKGSGEVTAEDSASAGDSTTISFKYDEQVTLDFTLKPWYASGTWSGYDDTVSSFKMPASHIEKTAYAEPIVYNLTVNCVWGNNCTPSRTYTVEDANIPLATPNRVHSEFAWWIGTDIEWTSGSVTIPSGSTWDRTYTATWTCHQWYHDTDVNWGSCQPDENTEYTVRHYLQDLSGEYTILTGTVTQTWKTDTETVAKVNTYEWFEVSHIATWIIKWDKSTVVDVEYNRLSYNWTVNSDVGVTNPTAVGDHPTGTAWTYKYEDTVKLSATLKDGYTFNGWTVEDASGNTIAVTNSDSPTNASFKMPASAVTITPSTTVNTYNITIIKNWGIGGTDDRTYTVETETFSLVAPTRDNSVFEWWSWTDLDWIQPTVTIAKWSTGHRTYEANFRCKVWYHLSGANNCVANEYNGKINYGDGEHPAPETIEFTYDQVTTLPNPEQSWYTFAWWDITWMSGGVQHHIWTITVTWDTYSGAMATEYMNLSTEQWMTDITFTALWTANPDTPYVVYHYVKNVGANSYTLSGTDELTWETDSELTLANLKKTFTGFAYSAWYLTGGTTRPTSGAVTVTTIDKKGRTAIYLYYDRTNYTVTLSGDAHVDSLSWTWAREFEYGANVTVSATAKEWYHFKEWKKSAPGS